MAGWVDVVHQGGGGRAWRARTESPNLWCLIVFLKQVEAQSEIEETGERGPSLWNKNQRKKKQKKRKNWNSKKESNQVDKVLASDEYY